MGSIIRELESYLIEKTPAKEGTSYRKALSKATERYKRLEETLNKEQRKLLSEYEDGNNEFLNEEASYHFRQGVKFGLTLGIETYYDGTDNE